MNKWIKRVVSMILVAAQFVIIPAVSASSLGDIQNEKEAVEIELNQVQEDMNEKLEEASKITIALDDLAQEIEEQENTIKQTEEEVEEQELVVEERYEHVADQLKVMQKSEINHNIILGLFESKSLSDLINRLHTANILTSANEDHLNEAQLEYEKLNDLKEEVLVYKEELDAKKSKTDQQKTALDGKLAGLKTALTNNENKLNQLNTEEASIKAEETKKKEASKAKERQVVIAEKKGTPTAKSNKSTKPVKPASSNDSKESASQSKPASSNDSKESASQSKPASSNDSKESASQSKPVEDTNAGSWTSFQSTGYSTEEKGLSTQTATGINLLKNPRVIAVDPSQIPLGSLVEIQGMGVYVAGDTGGAINGKIIDVHFSTVAQAMSWGRRNVKIRILN